MDPETRTEVRLATQRHRRAPADPIDVSVRFASAGEIGDEHGPGPIDLAIEATNDLGDLAPWFDDYWWTDRIERWADRAINLHITSTPGAVVHPVVLHQMEMVGRVAPRWRMIGHVFRDDLTSDEAIEVVASSPYHELRVIDVVRPTRLSTGRCDMDMPIEELFGKIRRAQARVGTSRPVLVRLPSGTPTPAAEVDQRAQVHAATSAPA